MSRKLDEAKQHQNEKIEERKEKSREKFEEGEVLLDNPAEQLLDTAKTYTKKFLD